MYQANRSSSRFHRLALGFLLATLLAVPLFDAQAAAQDRKTMPVRLDGMLPGGLRNSVTESWGAINLDFTNLSDADQQARVLIFYEGQPDILYGRDVWIPARSALKSWMLIGPTNAQDHKHGRDIQVVLKDRTGGSDQVLLPRSEERIRSRPFFYRKREPTTAILLDEDEPGRMVPGELPRSESDADEAQTLARTFRLTRSMSELVSTVHPGPLPPATEAFDGIDHFVIASRRLADDPLGQRALREWLQRGGRVWVMLDRVDPEVIRPVLGDALDFEVVDRVSLTQFRIEPQTGRLESPPVNQVHDRPVDFVRVLLPAGENPRHTINGWPAWFTRSVGRGRVLFTTLGSRGWYRPRRPPRDGDPRSPFENFPEIPMPYEPLIAAGEQWTIPVLEDSFDLKAFKTSVTEEIGYSVASRGTAGAIFAVFLLATLGLGFGLRRTRRAEWLGWLAPAAALTTAAIFFLVGERSRRAVPPTVAVGQVIDAGTGTAEVPVRGMLAAYRPTSGRARIASSQGGLLDLDMSGLDGQLRLHVMTDLNAWQIDNLTLPAGVRLGTFQTSVPTGEPITAVARFGPNGLEGKLTTGRCQDLADALVYPADGRNLAVQLKQDGTFSASTQDTLPDGQFLAGTLLNDQQQRRQEVYREFLKRSAIGRKLPRDLLLVWARPLDMHFSIVEDARLVGSALLVVPLRLERPAVGERLTIPSPFVPCRRVLDNVLAPITPSSSETTNMHLRFQVPPVVLPLKIERARLLARIDAPARRVTVFGRDGEKTVEVHRVESPLDPIRVEITDKRLLNLDSTGGLHLNVALGDLLGRDKKSNVTRDEKWAIRYLELEVAGRTE
jgi:hypothetical protein